MKVIVVSGAHSNVGKTQLARSLCTLFPGSVRVKIGHGERKSDDDGFFYHFGTGFATIESDYKNAKYLIIESNSILKEITPECAIYLKAENPKPSSEIAIKKADIVRGEVVPDSKISILAKRLECSEDVILRIIDLAGALKE